MLTRSAKAKGRRACSEVRDLMLGVFPSLEPDDILVTPSGVPGDDLKLSPKAQKILPWNVEVKNVEKINIWKSLEQAEARVEEGKNAVLFFKKNRTKLYACVDAEYLFKLIKDSNNDNKI